MAAHIDQAAWERKCRIRRTVILISASAVAAAVGLFCLIRFLIIPADRYKKAEAALDGGDAKSAIDYFGAAGNYKDATVRAAQIAAGLQEDAEIVDTIRDAELGSSVFLGSFEQDNRTGTGLEPIEWMVFEKKDGRALLLSKYVLFQAKFNDDRSVIEWENCTLRALLNSEFYETAFSPEERLLIASTKLENKPNPAVYNGKGSKSTKDKIFVLSYDEILEIARGYDGFDVFALDARPTDYAYRHGVDRHNEYLTACYWSRTSGYLPNTVMFVDMFGLLLHSVRPDAEDYGVRPAMWVYIGD